MCADAKRKHIRQRAPNIVVFGVNGILSHLARPVLLHQILSTRMNASAILPIQMAKVISIWNIQRMHVIIEEICERLFFALQMSFVYHFVLKNFGGSHVAKDVSIFRNTPFAVVTLSPKYFQCYIFP